MTPLPHSQCSCVKKLENVLERVVADMFRMCISTMHSYSVVSSKNTNMYFGSFVFQKEKVLYL